MMSTSLSQIAERFARAIACGSSCRLLATCIRRFEAMNFVNVIWGAQCGKSALWVLLGETSSRSHARSVRALARKRQTTARLRKGLPLQGLSLPSSGYDFRKAQAQNCPVNRRISPVSRTRARDLEAGNINQLEYLADAQVAGIA